ncbi:DUF4917 family protein [Peijinzhouia sedimentorum]
MKKLINFSEAIEKTVSCSTRHLLLGNGFSIACDPNIFTYDSIFKEADFGNLPEIKEAFKLLKVTDFELVIDALEKSSTILPAYQKESEDIREKMLADSKSIKEVLILTISSRHPAFPSQISEESYTKCRKFLSHFIQKKSNGRIYTLNYDLLLYWTLMHELDDKNSDTQFSDGFGRDSWVDNGEITYSDELTWQGKSLYQNIHYLHGGLHLFDKGHKLKKISWTDTGYSLIDQSRKALENDEFPLFVTEGDNLKKMEKIHHNAFLFNSFQSFEDITNAGKGPVGNTCLFTYGVSFSINDQHIFNRIAQGRIKLLLVSIYGDPNSSDNKRIISNAEALKTQRSKYPLDIIYYDASSAEVWN